ncbi:DNA polymerase Y family protein [uncultured Sphingomonas sp.]|uniref:Y-family DNA polymerase n=1 Tax=uncultured Sphingomonas sp. TaxID=158754 RepID=UPI0035CC7972
MKRVASLYLPEWPIDRLRRAGRIPQPQPEPKAQAKAGRRADHGASDDAADLLGRAAAAERAQACSVPNTPEGRPGALWSQDDRAASARHQGGNPGWRPGAKWARREIETQIAQLPLHQRPPMRELGRRSEAADHPFKAMPSYEARAPVPGRSAVPPVRWSGEGARSPGNRRAGDGPYPGEGAFFLTGRMTGDVVGRACKGNLVSPAPTAAMSEPPLVTAHRVNGRDVVHAANGAARAMGVTPGTWLTQARASVAGLIILPADPEGDSAALHRLAVALARRWAPTVAVFDETGLFIDLTGVAHLHGGETAFLHRLHRLLNQLGFRNRIAVADTAGAAWALAHSRRELSGLPLLNCPAGMHVRALEPLPVDLLRLESAHIKLLDRLGVDTVGELAKLPRAPLARRFGGALVRRLDQATGRTPEPLEPVAVPEQVVVEERYPEPIATAEVIEHRLGVLASRLATALERAGVGARALLLVADRVDGRAQTLRVGLSRPDRRPEHLLSLLRRRIEEIDPGFGIDALSLRVMRVEPLGPETLGPALAEETAPDLAPLIDLLANRLGGSTSWRVRPAESDVPERSVTPGPALDAPDRPAAVLKQGDVRRLNDLEADHPWHPRWPRPVHLLHRPEVLDFVMAEMPDHPPARFTWRGNVHRVVRADGPERIVGEWWRRTCERDAVRDYFSVEDEIGHRFWLFRRGDGVRRETGDLSWHLHGFHA